MSIARQHKNIPKVCRTLMCSGTERAAILYSDDGKSGRSMKK